MINNDQQCTVKSTIILLPELSVYYLILYRHESDIRRIFMKDYNAEKIFLYPPQNEVLGGYTVFSLSVIPSFRHSVIPSTF